MNDLRLTVMASMIGIVHRLLALRLLILVHPAGHSSYLVKPISTGCTVEGRQCDSESGTEIDSRVSLELENGWVST